MGPNAGKIVLILRTSYGLKSSGIAFRTLLVEVLWDLLYKPSKVEHDVYMRPAVKTNGLKYWEYFLVCVDNILCVSDKPLNTIKRLKDKIKLKDDKKRVIYAFRSIIV